MVSQDQLNNCPSALACGRKSKHRTCPCRSRTLKTRDISDSVHSAHLQCTPSLSLIPQRHESSRHLLPARLRMPSYSVNTSHPCKIWSRKSSCRLWLTRKYRFFRVVECRLMPPPCPSRWCARHASPGRSSTRIGCPMSGFPGPTPKRLCPSGGIRPCWETGKRVIISGLV